MDEMPTKEFKSNPKISTTSERIQVNTEVNQRNQPKAWTRSLAIQMRNSAEIETLKNYWE